MYVDSIDFAAMNVAAGVRPLVDYQTVLALSVGHICESSAEKAGSYNQIVVVFVVGVHNRMNS